MTGRMKEWVGTHRYCLAGLYIIVYLLGFVFVELAVPEPKYLIQCAVDDWIPFNEWFVIPYCLWYVWIPGFALWFMFRDKVSYLRLCFVLAVGSTVTMILYVLFPNGLDLRREITGTNFCAWLVRQIRAVDSPVNVCPSLHVSTTVGVHLAVLRAKSLREKRGVRALSRLMTLLISISTLFIKQHSFVDVACGAAVSLLFDGLWNVAGLSEKAETWG